MRVWAAVLVCSVLLPAALAYDCFHTPCLNGGTCHNATVQGDPFRCDCFVNYCGVLCDTVCPHTAAKAAWLVRASGQGTGAQGVELSGGLTQFNNRPYWTGSTFSSVVGIGNLSFTHTGSLQSSDAFTVAISPSGVDAYVASSGQQCVCTPSTDPLTLGTTPWGSLTSNAISGSVGSELPTGIIADSARAQVISTGTFSGLNIKLGAQSAPNAGSPGTNDAYFAAQATANGAVQWLRAYGGAGDDAVRDIATSSSTSASPAVVAVGTYTQAATFGAWVLPITHSDVNEQTGDQPFDIFAVWLNPVDGSVTNAAHGGGGGVDFAASVAVAESSGSGAVVVIGGEWSSANFTWNGQLLAANHNVTESPTGFVLALNSTGSAVWFRSFEGCHGVSRVSAVATVANGTRVLVAGQYNCVGWTFAGYAGPTSLRGSDGDFDMFVMSLNENGDAMWAVFGGGDGDDIASALTVDPYTFDVYLAGTFYSSTFTLPNGVSGDPPLQLNNYIADPATGILGQNAQALYVKFDDGTGRVIWGTSGGGNGNDFATDVVISPRTGRNGVNNAYLAGQFNSARFVFAGLVIGNTGLSDNSLGVSGDAFVMQFDENDDCMPNPCRNGGVCIDLANDFRCECPPDHNTNKICGYDSCVSFPCQNGGTCHNGIDSYTCECPAGTLGTNCQTNLDDCLSQPCHNGGTCVDGINAYTCQCAAGFAPPLCSDPDYCLSMPCANGATCNSFGQSYSCSCVPGYGPPSSCTQNIDECASGPCVSPATCVDHVNGYTCVCPPNRNGTICDQVLLSASSTGQSAAHRTAGTGAALMTAAAAAVVVAAAALRWP